jgi:alkylated DNA repair dioxygenase AlkB
MSFRPKAKVALGPAAKNQKGNKGDVLKIVLQHGDLVVMHGSTIQKLYEVRSDHGPPNMGIFINNL